MEVRTKTVELLNSLDALSNNKLTRRHDLGLLIDLAETHRQLTTLEELSFDAKFASKTVGIMQRIGTTAEGYDRLAGEFGRSLKKIRDHLALILLNAPEQMRQEFSATYLEMTHECLEQLLALCYDLSWYKNWLLDHRERRQY